MRTLLKLTTLLSLSLIFACAAVAAADAAFDKPFEADDQTVLLLHFDGDVKDAGPLAVDIEAEAPAYAGGRFGQALDCSDLGRTIVRLRAGHDPRRAITLECWLFHQGSARGRQHRVAGRGSAYGFTIEKDKPKLTWYIINNGGKRAAVEAAIPEKKWTHVAGTYDGKVVRLFVDGELVAEAQHQGKINATRRPFFLGRTGAFKDDRSKWFNGLIDELRLSNGVRYGDNAATGEAVRSDPAPKPDKADGGAEAAVADAGDDGEENEARRNRRYRQDARKPITPDPDLPDVLLIGDSISIGYTVPTRERLAGRVNVFRIPDNAGAARDSHGRLDSWLGDRQWDVIHFNWGLHDLKYVNKAGKKTFKDGEQVNPVEQYEKDLDQLVRRLKQTGAELIFATTTPVGPGAGGRRNEDVAIYNEAARRVMAKYDVTINDLYARANPRKKELLNPSKVHFWTKGCDFNADAVAAAIEAKLREAGKLK